jgi:ferredoxin
MSVKVTFTPDNVEVLAEAGEPILNVAERAGVYIPTGCLAGSCRACEVEIGVGGASPQETRLVCACMMALPSDRSEIIIGLYEDSLW